MSDQQDNREEQIVQEEEQEQSHPHIAHSNVIASVHHEQTSPERNQTKQQQAQQKPEPIQQQKVQEETKEPDSNIQKTQQPQSIQQKQEEPQFSQYKSSQPEVLNSQYTVPPTPEELLRAEQEMRQKDKLINEILKMYDDFERLEIRSEELQQQNQYFIDKINQFEKIIYETDPNQP